jgi:polyisoprenoid-binding protein YceI
MIIRLPTQNTTMRISVWLSGFLLMLTFGFAQYHPVESGSKVQFTIKNFGFNVGGSFRGIRGDIRFNPDSLSAARFEVAVEASTIDTDNDLRDGHLREEDYLDVKKYPHIRFVSEQVRTKRKGEYEMTGKLTIRDKTKSISFPFAAAASGKGYLFTGSFKISRKDFDVGGSSTISDNLTVNLKVLAE